MTDFQKDVLKTIQSGEDDFSQKVWRPKSLYESVMVYYHEGDKELGYCIDDRLLMRCFFEDDVLMRFLGFERDLFGDLQPIGKGRAKGDKGQRNACGCIQSKDIGEYNTCPHQCVYCCANRTAEGATRNALCANLTDSIRGF